MKPQVYVSLDKLAERHDTGSKPPLATKGDIEKSPGRRLLAGQRSKLRLCDKKDAQEATK
jgi:hypothetical protein